jgi:uncharacterized membrane protein
MKDEKNDLKAIQDAIRDLGERVAQLERNQAKIQAVSGEDISSLEYEQLQTKEDQVSLEFRIGQYWIAQVGAIVLLFGIAFFISYPLPGFPPLVAVIFGFSAVAGLIILSLTWRKAYSYLSQILFGGSLVLLYFATLRLHFISEQPLLPQKFFGITLLLLVLVIDLILSIRKNSEILATIIMILFYITALFIDTAFIAFPLIIISSIITAYLLLMRNWRTLTIVSVVAAFTSHLIWLFNNPLAGNSLRARPSPQGNLAFLVLYGTVFALGAVSWGKKQHNEVFDAIGSILIGSGIFIIGMVNVLSYHRDETNLYAALTALFFMGLALATRKIDRMANSASLYVCFSFVALTIFIFSQFPAPDYFIWLGLQSLLVILIAIWFRSRIIVLANIFIYLGIYLWYLMAEPSNDLVNLSYAVAALVSARVLNWKKDRLTLKTDLIRNLYLISAFIIVLWGLDHAVPQKFVSLSWLGAALLYFAISLILKNKKYRWMAILTIFATVIHIFIIDLSRHGHGFRVILFVVVGVVLVLFSLAYAWYRKKSSETDAG